MLTSQQEKLWSEYEAVESCGTREAKIRALELFVEHLTQAPITEWESWARAIAERVVDLDEDFSIHTPLFRHVVFPALLKGHHNQLPGCARWLAGLSQYLYRSPDCQSQLPDAEQYEIGLLWAAIRQDPTDRLAGQRLIDALSFQLRYSLHELPTGVLYGHNGATAEQCLELQKELQEFVDLLEQQERLFEFQELIDKCRFHFREYRAYLLRVKEFNSYSDYLNEVAR